MTGPSFQDVQRAFAAHLRDPAAHPAPEGLEDRRMKVYRELFYNNVESFLRNGFPVLRTMLDDERWHLLVRGFFRDHACTSPWFVDIPRAFVEFLANGCPAGDWPPFLLELAHYEYMELALDISTEEIPDEGLDPDGDLLAAPPVLSPLMCVLGYHWPVHRISPQFVPEQPLAEPVRLVVWRDRDDRVRFMEINAATARLLQLVEEMAGQDGRAVLAALAVEMRITQEKMLVFGSDILEMLRDRQLVLGARTAGCDEN